ncbi:MAG: VacJ family lipoprotein [Campylobacteraceae bacterium]|nr:VacJ family lipoprotein [Campylobacteraceae bacterium]
MITLFIFTSCTSKKIDLPDQKENKMETNLLLEDDDFNDEFSEEEEIVDPLKYYNIMMTSVNDKIFTYGLNPIASAYDYTVHDNIKVAVSNFFSNLMYPIRFVNNVLQFKFKNASEETGRFLINSTVGLFGLFDLAKNEFNLNPHNEDFGQTLGHWGVGPGFHIVLPIFGPSNLRDSIGLFTDAYLDPTFSKERKSWKIPNNNNESILLNTTRVVNNTSLKLGQYENLKKDSINLYPFLRDTYEQKREQEIKE